MAFCYCCIYSEMIEVGTYKCKFYHLDDDDGERADVSDCNDFTYDDSFDESTMEDCYEKCYLKEICYEKYCEG